MIDLIQLKPNFGKLWSVQSKGFIPNNKIVTERCNTERTNVEKNMMEHKNSYSTVKKKIRQIILKYKLYLSNK